MAPGQEQKAHRHDDQDKIYYVLEGHGRFRLGGAERRSDAGEALVAPAGVEHGLVNDGDARPARPRSGDAAAAARMTDRRASLMITCLGDLFFPEVGVAMVRLLRRLGVTVDFPADQTCCGLPLFNSGYHDEAAAGGRRTVTLFAGAEHVVVPSGSCAWMVKDEYPGLLAGTVFARAAGALATRTRELSQFLVGVLGVTEFTSAVPGRVTYHDSCHLLRGLGESRAPRTLLGKLEGVGAGRAARTPTSAAASADRSRCGCPRSRRPSSTRSSPTSRRPAPSASSPATPAASCRCAAGSRAANSRVRALHLAQVLAGER